MTTQAMTMTGGTGTGRSGRLEELVDRLIDALFGETDRPADSAPQVRRRIHDARRLRRAGDLDGALAMFAEVDATGADRALAHWAHSEWLRLIRERFGGEAFVYSPATGRAAALVASGDGALEVVATLGMRWPVGKRISRRSLRGLKPLRKGGA